MPAATVCGEILDCERRINVLTEVPWFHTVLNTSPKITVAVGGSTDPAPEVGYFMCGQITVGVSGGTWDTRAPASFSGFNHPSTS